METRTTRRKKPGIKNKRKSKTKPSSEGFFNNKYSATERQYLKKELKEETPPASRKHWTGDPWYNYDFDDRHEYDEWEWIGYSGYITETVGGKFIDVLRKLDIVLVRNTEERQEIHWLYGHVAITPNGTICGDVDEKAKLEKIFNKRKADSP